MTTWLQRGRILLKNGELAWSPLKRVHNELYIVLVRRQRRWIGLPPARLTHLTNPIGARARLVNE